MNYLRFHEGNQKYVIRVGESETSKVCDQVIYYSKYDINKERYGIIQKNEQDKGCTQRLLHTKCPHWLNRLVLWNDHRIVSETLLSPWNSRCAPMGHQVLLICILSMIDNRLGYLWINISSCIFTIEKNAPEHHCSSHARIDKTIIILDPGAPTR